MKVAAMFVFGLLIIATLPALELRVDYEGSEPQAPTQQIFLQFSLFNLSSENLALSDVTLRYYYPEQKPLQQEFNVDFAGLGSSNITGLFAPGYVEVGFTQGSGNLSGGTSSGKVYIRLNKKDWSVYTPAIPSIALFYRGNLIWGNPPATPAKPSPTPTPTI